MKLTSKILEGQIRAVDNTIVHWNIMQRRFKDNPVRDMDDFRDFKEECYMDAPDAIPPDAMSTTLACHLCDRATVDKELLGLHAGCNACVLKLHEVYEVEEDSISVCSIATDSPWRKILDVYRDIYEEDWKDELTDEVLKQMGMFIDDMVDLRTKLAQKLKTAKREVIVTKLNIELRGVTNEIKLWTGIRESLPEKYIHLRSLEEEVYKTIAKAGTDEDAPVDFGCRSFLCDTARLGMKRHDPDLDNDAKCNWCPLTTNGMYGKLVYLKCTFDGESPFKAIWTEARANPDGDIDPKLCDDIIRDLKELKGKIESKLKEVKE